MCAHRAVKVPLEATELLIELMFEEFELAIELGLVGIALFLNFGFYIFQQLSLQLGHVSVDALLHTTFKVHLNGSQLVLRDGQLHAHFGQFIRHLGLIFRRRLLEFHVFFLKRA